MMAKLKYEPDLTKAVIKLLHGVGIGSVWVRVGTIIITPKPIRGVADAIKAGKIAVYHDPHFLMAKNQYSAFYDGGYNAMFVGFSDPDTVGRKAVIVHEAVHAVNDIKKRSSIVHIDDEAAAFTAQAMYIRGLGNRPPIRLKTKDTTIDDVYAASFAVADRIFGGMAHPTSEIDTLRDKIRAMGGDYATNADSTVGYDGL
jgi:hypothetical protein